MYVYKINAHAQHICIFEEIEPQGQKKLFEKILLVTKYPNQIAFNDEKTRVENLMLGHLN